MIDTISKTTLPNELDVICLKFSWSLFNSLNENFRFPLTCQQLSDYRHVSIDLQMIITGWSTILCSKWPKSICYRDVEYMNLSRKLMTYDIRIEIAIFPSFNPLKCVSPFGLKNDDGFDHRFIMFWILINNRLQTS